MENNIEFTILERKDGMFQPRKEYGNKTLYPAFESLRDAIIFMEYTEKTFKPGVVGNVQIVRREK